MASKTIGPGKVGRTSLSVTFCRVALADCHAAYLLFADLASVSACYDRKASLFLSILEILADSGWRVALLDFDVKGRFPRGGGWMPAQ